MGEGSRGRSLFCVSATHVGTLQWHTMWGLPIKVVVSDYEKLAEKGVNVGKAWGEKVFIDQGEVTCSNDYGIHSDKVRKCEAVKSTCP